MPDLRPDPHPHRAAVALSLSAARRLLDSRAAFEREDALSYRRHPARPGPHARSEQAYRWSRYAHDGAARAALIDARAACEPDFYPIAGVSRCP